MNKTFQLQFWMKNDALFYKQLVTSQNNTAE